MEPMVIFTVGLVVYCGYLSFLDTFRNRKGNRVLRDKAVKTKKPCPEPARVTFSGHGRGGGAGAHWPRLAKGSA
jgi:hypothetical protein